MHTVRLTVKRASWLVGNDKDSRVERRAGGLVGQQAGRHGQVDKLAGHSGGRAGKHVQVGEIAMVDGTDSVWGFGGLRCS